MYDFWIQAKTAQGLESGGYLCCSLEANHILGVINHAWLLH